MSTPHRIAAVVHVLSLSIWAALILAAGLAAAVAFPTMKPLNPTLPDFAAYPHDHWLIAAGHIANRIFHFTDTASIALAAIAMLSALVLIRQPAPRVRVLWLVTLAAAAITLVYSLAILRPRMDRNLDEFWTTARAGQVETADAARARFDADHPTASRLISAQLAFVLLALGTISWSLACRRP